MQWQEEIDLNNLPDEAKKTLIEFYNFLLNKYGKIKKKPDKKSFFESVKKHSVHLPENYKFNREEIYER